MLQDAYEDPKASGMPITLWGVDIDPSHPINDARVSVVLMKFLRARNLSIPDARDMFISTLRWRKIFDIEAALKEEFPQEVFGQLGHIYGEDKEGRTVVYNLYGANKDLKTVFGDVQRFLRWRIALHEKSILTLDFINVDQTIQIHDYEGVGLSSRDTNSKAAASEATSIFANHYPELLYKKFFINVPALLNWLFWAMKPLVPTNTLAKMSVVGTGQHAVAKALLPYIDVAQLPARYGGEAKAF
ncbi:hypothetical protein AX15_006463 [Amanita polypyramis BW_CC]|nr:hypothetical protein AX15_006463 [Amanita polypyramis BW_CC]